MTNYEEKDYSKKFNFGVWLKLKDYIMPYKKYFITLLLLMGLIAVIDAVNPILIKYAVDNFIMKKKYDYLYIFIIISLLIAIIQGLNVRTFIMVAGKIETEVTYNIRKKLFNKVHELNVSYFDKTPTGWIVSRITSDIRNLGHTLSWHIVDLSWSSLMMIMMLVFMFILNWKLAMIIMIIVPVLVLISIYFQMKILKSTRLIKKNNSYLTTAFSEEIMGVKTIKTLVKEEHFFNEFKNLTEKYWHSSMRAAIYSAVYTPIVLFLGSIGTVAILVKGGFDVNNSVISYGTLAAFISYTIYFFEPVKMFARIFTQLQHSQASIERVFTLLETKSEIVDREEVIEIYGDYKKPKRENWEPVAGNIEFKNITFFYKAGEEVLRNFNLLVKKGEKIAFVGETGVGKTTVINLLCRFFEPISGRILIDGIDYKKRSQSWLRSNIGYVLQEPHLFSGSIRDNISYANKLLAKEKIIEAAKLVNAHEFIVKFENGYDEDVGEGGNKLSKGQKQLVSFARAIVNDPPIIILDEATSSVDGETELKIQMAIKNILKNRTSFIIAHRLSTIKTADRILVIGNGNIVEDGTHHELIDMKGEYYNLYMKQFADNLDDEVSLKEA